MPDETDGRAKISAACVITGEREQAQSLAGIWLSVPFYLCSHSKLQAELAFGSRGSSGPNFSSLKYPDCLGQVKEQHYQLLGLTQEAQYVLLHLFGSGNYVQLWECSGKFAIVNVILVNWKSADFPD